MTLVKILLAILFALPASAQLVTITGTFQYPDGNVLNGKVIIRLTRSTVNNTCVSPVQVLVFQPVTVKITAGVLGTLSLYATPCLSPSIFYTISVFDQNNTLLYTDHWNVPNQASADVTIIGVGH